MHSRTTTTSTARKSMLWLTTAVATAALAFGGATTASAASDDGIEQYTVPSSQVIAASTYWTAERMESAIDADQLVPSHANLGASASTPAADRGTPTRIAGQEPRAATAERRASVTPISHIGKVFFTLGGSNYVCSGNAVVSANERTVSTAGHCLNEGPGAYATNFVFVPAYQNGNAPYGTWAATELHAPSAWVNGGDINVDTAFAVVASPSGSSATLSDTVGASGVAFNQARGLTYQAYGYPASGRFNGETLQTCAGTARDDTYGGTQSQGIPCNMTGGSSGGPWFIGSGSSGYQNSVNSFGYGGVRNTMFGPYWGSVIQSTYNAAQS